MLQERMMIVDNRIKNQKIRQKNQKIGSEKFGVKSARLQADSQIERDFLIKRRNGKNEKTASARRQLKFEASSDERGRCLEEADEVHKKGISLISLIITIIVIIILAAIVIFSGFGATESAQFAKFSQEFSSYQEEMEQKYQNEKLHSSTQGENKLDSEIYAEIAGGGEETISSLLGGETLSDGLNGTNCYEIHGARSFYGEQARVYITDKGEIFTLPGYRYSQNGEERRYVNANKYYLGDGTVLPEGNTVEVVEMTGAPTVDGTIAVGDYVEYLPDSGEYTNNEVPEGKAAKDYYLGHTTSGTLTTDTATKWRVVRINDGAGEAGEILITPADAVNTEIKLAGAPGYLNYVRVLDYICGKLYSNSELGTKARSMRIEDLDYTTSDSRRYAYYSNSTEDAPNTPNVTVNEVTYTGKRHDARNTSYTYRAITFWEYDEGTDESCIREKEINGYTYSYATPTGDKPVLVTGKNDGLATGSKTTVAINVIGSNWSWLASPWTSLGNTNAFFGVRGADSAGAYYSYLAYSNGNAYKGSSGLHPLVTLGSGLQLETTGEGTPGSESNPWRITK